MLGEFHGKRSLAGYSLWGLDTTERLNFNHEGKFVYYLMMFYCALPSPLQREKHKRKNKSVALIIIIIFFLGINSFLFCLLYGLALTIITTTGKTIALTIQTFVGRVVSLLFNTLSSVLLSFAFLLGSNHLLKAAAPSSVILEPKKMKFVMQQWGWMP